MEHTILVSAFLREDKVRYFDRLETYLRQFGFRLLLASLGGEEIETDCRYVIAPTHSGKQGGSLNEQEGLSREFVLAIAMESDFRGIPMASAAQNTLRYAQFMRELMLKERPCLCVLWNQFTGLHRALSAVCDELAVPTVFAHLGLLPGTIVFEQGGQMAESWVAQEAQRFKDMPVGDGDLAMARDYLENVRGERRTRKPQTSEWSIGSVVGQARAKGRKTVFYAGQNDPHSGMWPTWLPEARSHSPFFVHTLDALQFLARLAEKNDWQILFKPHPNIQERQTGFQLFCDDKVDFVTGANVFECICESDLTVTVLSQVSYLALIHEHPVALLGRNQLSGKGCVYEPSSLYDVEQTIQEALRDGITEDRHEHWVKHVAQLCRYYLFSYDQDTVSLLGRDVDEAARYLMLNSRFPAPLWGEYDADQSSLEAGATPPWLRKAERLCVRGLRKCLPQAWYEYVRGAS